MHLRTHLRIESFRKNRDFQRNTKGDFFLIVFSHQNVSLFPLHMLTKCKWKIYYEKMVRDRIRLPPLVGLHTNENLVRIRRSFFEHSLLGIKKNVLETVFLRTIIQLIGCYLTGTDFRSRTDGSDGKIRDFRDVVDNFFEMN